MANKKPVKKAAQKKAAPRKIAPKKAAPKPAAKRINVFSNAFTTMVHNAAVDLLPELIVECNVDGDLTDDQGNILKFTSLDAANECGAAHRKATGHKCIVKTSQGG